MVYFARNTQDTRCISPYKRNRIVVGSREPCLFWYKPSPKEEPSEPLCNAVRGKHNLRTMTRLIECLWSCMGRPGKEWSTRTWCSREFERPIDAFQDVPWWFLHTRPAWLKTKQGLQTTSFGAILALPLCQPSHHSNFYTRCHCLQKSLLHAYVHPSSHKSRKCVCHLFLPQTLFFSMKAFITSLQSHTALHEIVGRNKFVSKC